MLCKMDIQKIKQNTRKQQIYLWSMRYKVIGICDFFVMLLQRKGHLSFPSSSCCLTCMQVAGPAIVNDKMKATYWNGRELEVNELDLRYCGAFMSALNWQYLAIWRENYLLEATVIHSLKILIDNGRQLILFWQAHWHRKGKKGKWCKQILGASS